MISFDFDYYKPDTLQEAFDCHHCISAEGRSVWYYGGGTELISLARAESIQFDAVIDLKGIAECTRQGIEKKDLVLGSALTLSDIAEAGHYPLLCKTVSRIADHTIQRKVTLGGNLGGSIKYREAALPLMICGSRATVMTRKGPREIPFRDVFDGRLRLAAGDFLINLKIPEEKLTLPHVHVKKTKMDKIDYPLITFCAHREGGVLSAAISGYGHTPMLLSTEALEKHALSEEERIAKTVSDTRDAAVSDIHGSREYRMFVLSNILRQTLLTL